MTVLAEMRGSLTEVLIGRDQAPAWRSPRTRRLAMALGWAGFAVVAVAGLVAEDIGGAGGRGSGALGWLAVGLAVAAALPLAPRYALLAWRIAFLGVLLTPLIPGQSRADAGFYAVLAVTFAVAGVRYGPWHAWWMWFLSLIPVGLWTGPDWVYPAVNIGWLAFLSAGAHALSYWRRDRRELAAQTALARQQLEKAERQRERSAVLEERARIAREMHDVVAHHMSMIAVQAETAPYRVPDLPGPAQKEFAALSDAAREALTDMRRLLGVLRSDSTSDNSNKRPQPRIGDVAELVETARRAGALVSLTVPPALSGAAEFTSVVPASVSLAAYRIVQESLSNAARHAPGARVSVIIEETPSSVRIIVSNEPSAGLPREEPGTGHGLAGMRERAEMLGGELSAGPEPDGGFAVRALLPLGAQA